MNEILVIGSGAREHALCWKAAQSPLIDRVFCAPGNPGITEVAECISITSNDITGLTRFAKRQKIGLTIVGPEVPLSMSIVDRFKEDGLAIFGPNQRAFQIEGSKVFAKALMVKYGIPTARFHSFHPDNVDGMINFLKNNPFPLVIKEDGLAAGKGATVVRSLREGLDLSRQLLADRKKIVVEDFLEGDEVSVTTLCNGESFVPFLLSQDHKPIHEGGPNTGGMGVYAPLTFVDERTERLIYDRIVEPTLGAMLREGIYYTGVLYSNIMLTENGPMVLEHNARFGDPETQALLPLLNSDLVEVLSSVLANEFAKIKMGWLNKFCVSLTLASGGYPGEYEKGKIIEGIEDARRMDGILVFHAGTAIKDNHLVTAGGRVLSVVGVAENLETAVRKAYVAADKISFEGKYLRRDIAKRSLRRYNIFESKKRII